MNFLLLAFLPALIAGHGSLVEPPARATMHDYGFPHNPKDSNWMEGFCGGKSHQWSPAIGGKCGICGDAWDASPRQHEAPGGMFANGIIVRNYGPGEEITVTAHITANHIGFMELRLCRNNDIGKDPEQSCFEEPGAALTFISTGEDKFWVTDDMGSTKISAQVRLPNWECEHCILQWTYRNGRDWGTCNGACGQVETFRACSDISISRHAGPNTTNAASMTSTTKASSPQPTTVNKEDPTTSLEQTSERHPTWSASTPTSSSDSTCKATGSWAGLSKVDAWCDLNCFHIPPFCPETVCHCSDSPKVKQATECQAVGVWTGNMAMTVWCQNNCNTVEQFCPPSLCQCDEL